MAARVDAAPRKARGDVDAPLRLYTAAMVVHVAMATLVATWRACPVGVF